MGSVHIGAVDSQQQFGSQEDLDAVNLGTNSRLEKTQKANIIQQAATEQDDYNATMDTLFTQEAMVEAHQPVEQNPEQSSTMRIEQPEEELKQQQVAEEDKDVKQVDESVQEL